jgi:hypothetical protein
MLLRNKEEVIECQKKYGVNFREGQIHSIKTFFEVTFISASINTK